MPASIQTVLSSASPQAVSETAQANVSQANASATGSENGRPFADTLSKQIEKHQQGQSGGDKQAAAQRPVVEGGNTRRQILATQRQETGKELPPAAATATAEDCDCVDDEQLQATVASELKGWDRGLQRAMLAGQNPKFETALENVSKRDTHSALLDLMRNIETRGVDGVLQTSTIDTGNFLIGGSAQVVSDEQQYVPLSMMNDQPVETSDVSQTDLIDTELLFSVLPLNAMDLPKEVGQWLSANGDGDKASGMMAMLYTRIQALPGQGQGITMAGNKQDMLHALQTQLGTSFELAGDYEGSVEVLNAQREVMNMQAMFGGGNKDSDGGVGGLFKLIALQKVAMSVNDAQLGDRMQFQQMLQNQLMGNGNNSLYKALGSDFGDSMIPLLQANGALMHSQAQGQGSLTQANILTTSSTINQPLGQPGWDQAVGERLQWMVKKDLQLADLKLNPRHLGPIEVKIAMGQDQVTTVHFTASHVATREAIEAALPRLREMLGDSGLTQVDVNVSQHSHHQGQQAQDGDKRSSQGGFDNALQHADENAAILEEESGWRSMQLQRSSRLLDAFV